MTREPDSAVAGRAAAGRPGDGGSGRPLRADARRNRQRVLDVAFAVFAAEGLAVPVHEIARRAGVGTGTVSRHFPTKEALFQAVFIDRVERLDGRARALAAAADPGAAFMEFFALLVAEGAANRGLAEALAGAGFDLEAAASGADHDIMGALRGLLARAQRAGAVRDDVQIADVKALLAGCLARERDAADAAGRDRVIAIVSQGLRPDPPAARRT
jgi:AcrR family transcriptional regulator